MGVIMPDGADGGARVRTANGDEADEGTKTAQSMTMKMMRCMNDVTRTLHLLALPAGNQRAAEQY